MYTVLRWLSAMLSVYAEMLKTGEIQDREQVTGAVVILATMFVFGPLKGAIIILVVLIIIALKDGEINSRIHSKLRK